ncbi:Scr1 family TA system antitoxin-like transcriptional regulator [Streptomyces exfoliatus]|uniref:Scr1 family TA system antitoxin-like transcriptional regulator n=1 Tax=Streptomyces exfoliatus TaxID=1905 RepID=UPI000464F90F|nr:Scr1 family TA system antitoxin-like transcriptional regulator [Streptomyces exfoliatus]
MPAEKEIDPSESLESFIADMVRDARKQRGWRQQDLAAKVFSSTTRISEIENGDPPDLKLGRQLDQVLELGGRLANLLVIRDRVAFRDYAQGFLRDQARARSIYEFSLVVPGLLQTPAYARAIMRLEDPDGVTDIDGSVQRRSERQAIFDGPQPPWMWLVLDEWALTKVMGSRKVMREQIEWLLEATQRPFINVQVLRTDRAVIRGSVSLLTLASGEQTAYTEGFGTGRYMVEAAEVDVFRKIYDRLHADALGVDESQEFMRDALGMHDD